MAINTQAPTTLSSLLLGDESAGSLSYTEVAGQPVSAILELQSTDAAFLLPRMTQTERDELEVVCPGMVIYNTTSGVCNFREGNVWHDITAGSVSGPGVTVNNTIPVWDGVAGDLLKDTGVTIDALNGISGLVTISVNSGFTVDNASNVTGVNSLTMPSGLNIDANANINSANNIIAAQVATQFTGAANFPAFAIGTDNTLGIYSSGGNLLDFTVFATRQLQIASGGAATVNYIRIRGAATGVTPFLEAAGSDANVDIGLTARGTGSAAIRGNSSGTGNQGALKFWNKANTFYTQLKAQEVGANATFSLPSADSATIVGPTAIATPLTSNSAGVLSFSTQVPCAATCSLTAAQILALYNTPILLITNPGGNQSIIVHSVMFEYTNGGTSFTGGGNVYLQYSNTAHGTTTYATAPADVPASFITGASALTRISGHLGAAGSLGFASVRGLSLYITNDTGVFATGNGTVKLFITYSIYPT